MHQVQIMEIRTLKKQMPFIGNKINMMLLKVVMIVVDHAKVEQK